MSDKLRKLIDRSRGKLMARALVSVDELEALLDDRDELWRQVQDWQEKAYDRAAEKELPGRGK